jgi:hypothetical protein
VQLLGSAICALAQEHASIPALSTYVHSASGQPASPYVLALHEHVSKFEHA